MNSSIFTAITGIGPAKAKQLIEAGAKTVNDLLKPRFAELVPESALLHIKLNPQSIPYVKALKLQTFIGNIGTISGSFRRAKPILNDIDIVCLQENVEKLLGILKPIVYARGQEKIAGFLRLRGGIYVRLDIFICTERTLAGTILYTTGSKEFNIRMRAIAKKQGYVLNQHGLFRDNIQIPTKHEKDIFAILKMEWQSPLVR